MPGLSSFHHISVLFSWACPPRTVPDGRWPPVSLDDQDAVSFSYCFPGVYLSHTVWWEFCSSGCEECRQNLSRQGMDELEGCPRSPGQAPSFDGTGDSLQSGSAGLHPPLCLPIAQATSPKFMVPYISPGCSGHGISFLYFHLQCPRNRILTLGLYSTLDRRIRFLKSTWWCRIPPVTAGESLLLSLPTLYR